MKLLQKGSIFTVVIFLFQNIICSNGLANYSQLNGLKDEDYRQATEFVHENEDSEILHRLQRSSASGLADIARFVDKAKHNYTLYVDDTMARLIFQVVTFNTTPIINVTVPSGALSNSTPITETHKNGTIVTTYDIAVTSVSDFGNWTFTRLDGYTWDVTVQGKSPVVITHEFFEVGTNTLVHDSQLFANKQYKLRITVSGLGDVASVGIGRFFSKGRRQLEKMLSFTNIDDNVFEISNTSVLGEIFYVGIEGKDNSNNTFVRIDPAEINPVLFRLDVSPSSGAQIYQNSTVNVTFTIISYLTSDKYIKVSASDTLGLLLPPKQVSNTLKTGENLTGTFVLQAGAVQTITTVKIMVQYYFDKKYMDGPVVVRTFNVVTNDTFSSQQSDSTDSPQTGSSTAAIAGGVSGALLLLIAVVIGVIVYKKVTNKRNRILHKENTDMPKNTKFPSEE